MDFDTAFQLAWTEHRQELYLRALRSGESHCDAEELVQLVFMRMARQWKRFDGGRLLHWLSTLLRYEILTRRSSKSLKTGVRSDQVPDTFMWTRAPHPNNVSPSVLLEQRQLLQRIERWISQLDEEERTVFQASFVEGMLNPEACAHMNQTHGTCLSHDTYAARKRRLRQRLIRDMESNDV